VTRRLRNLVTALYRALMGPAHLFRLDDMKGRSL
jgi:hypothetical protein